MQSYGRAIIRAHDRAGLTPRMTSHALRHYFATTQLRAGLSPVAVGHLLGHTDGSLVVATYAHAMPEDATLARAAMQAALTAEQPEQPTLRAVQ